MSSSVRADPQPRFSVIIPTYHRDETLAMCLDRLAPGTQTTAPEEYEVIVSDDGVDTTAEEMIRTRFPWARWVPGPRKGPAANRNNGAVVARGAWLLFTDDDCLPAPDWIANYRQHVAGSALALEGCIRPQRSLRNGLEMCPINETGGFFWTANVAVAASLFWQVGGFSDAFPYAFSEDQDLYYRLQARTKIPFVNTAVVVHPVTQQTLRSAISRIRRACYSYTVLVLRHRTRLDAGTVGRVVEQGARFNAHALLRALRRLDWFGAGLSFLYLTYGTLLSVLYYSRLKGRIGEVDTSRSLVDEP